MTEVSKPIPDLRDYWFSERCGFLVDDPLETLPVYFDAWNMLGKDMPSLFERREMREAVYEMQLLDHTKLVGYRQYRLAFTLLSMIGNAFVWQEGDKGVTKVIPRQLAIPWYGVSDHLGLQPGVCHASLVLSNWKVIDPDKPLHYTNMRAISKLPGSQSNWFIIITAQTELDAVPGIKSILKGLHAVLRNDQTALLEALHSITSAIFNMIASFKLLHEGLDADVFYNEIRPCLAGWGGEGSAIPEGIVFEGVSDEPKKVVGGSAAQSSPVQCFDAALRITHSPDKQAFLERMKDYMPPAHAKLVQAIRQGPNIKDFVQDSSNSDLQVAYNQCVEELKRLRSYHIQLVAKYIIAVSSRKSSTTDYKAVAKRGTGGQTLMPFLKGLRNSTDESKIQ